MLAKPGGWHFYLIRSNDRANQNPSTFNSNISTARRTNLQGTYDIHTNSMQYPKIMQPSHARWERVPPPDPRIASRLAQGLSSLSLTNGTEKKPSNDNDNNNPEEPANTDNPTTHEDNTTTTPFPTVPAPLSRRFAIHDVHYETPLYSNMGIPGPDGDVHDLGTNGLISVANPRYPEFLGPDILDELPPECKEALLETAAREWEWKSKWSGEAGDTARTTPLKSYAWFP